MMLRKLYQGIALSSSRKLSEGNSTDPDSRASSKAQVRAEQPHEAAKSAAKCDADAHQEGHKSIDGSRPASLDAFRKSLKTGIKVGSRAPCNAGRLIDASARALKAAMSRRSMPSCQTCAWPSAGGQQRQCLQHSGTRWPRELGWVPALSQFFLTAICS